MNFLFNLGPTSSKLEAKQGFTLIELLTVIAIIALLASIILASLNTARQRSRDGKRVSDIKNLELALSLYYNDNSAYPTTLASLVPTYISSLPTDPNYSVTSATCVSSPTTAGCYQYAALGSGASCTAYHLGANLEQSSNSAINNDFSTSNQTYAAQTACTGSAADWGHAATPPSAPCRADTGVNSSSYCYDVHS